MNAQKRLGTLAISVLIVLLIPVGRQVVIAQSVDIESAVDYLKASQEDELAESPETKRTKEAFAKGILTSLVETPGAADLWRELGIYDGWPGPNPIQRVSEALTKEENATVVIARFCPETDSRQRARARPAGCGSPPYLGCPLRW